MTVLERLGVAVARRRRAVLAVAAVLIVLAGVVAAGALSAFSLARFELTGSESVRAKEVLASQFSAGSADVVLLVTAKRGTVDALRTRGEALTAAVKGTPGVADAWSYWSTGSATLHSTDRKQALVAVRLAGDVNVRRTVTLPRLERLFVQDNEILSVGIGGGEEVFRQGAAQSREDFVRAEIIILPLLLGMLWLLLRRFWAALIPLLLGLAATAGTLAALRGLAAFTEVSTFAANLTLALGLGLGVDYGLLMVMRFRAELAGGGPVAGAVGRTVRTAGRTVIFSGVTVAASLAMLLLFPFPFLRSFGYAGVAVLLISVLGALTITPAMLAVAGRRILRPATSRRPEEGFWHRLAEQVMRRPVVYGTTALLVLLILASPVLGLRFGDVDDRILPPGTSSRTVSDQIRAHFPAEETDGVQVVAPKASGPVTAYAARLSRLPDVFQVDSAAGVFVDGRLVRPSGREFSASSGTFLTVFMTEQRLDSDPDGFVRQIRTEPAPFPVLVGGYPAELSDFRDGLLARTPVVLLLGLLATAVILFLMTGSLLLPLKATVLNLLSLAVMFGAVVWIFQQGNLSGLLGFTPTGAIDTTMPILMLCVVYGLSMDYEVFLLARTAEEFRRVRDNRRAVAIGLGRSGPIVTAAALMLAVTFALYATSGISFLKMIGIGTAVAIAVDATVIRGILVPAFMLLAGDANWWAPPTLRRLHARLGLSE